MSETRLSNTASCYFGCWKPTERPFAHLKDCTVRFSRKTDGSGFDIQFVSANRSARVPTSVIDHSGTTYATDDNRLSVTYERAAKQSGKQYTFQPGGSAEFDFRNVPFKGTGRSSAPNTVSPNYCLFTPGVSIIDLNLETDAEAGESSIKRSATF